MSSPIWVYCFYNAVSWNYLFQKCLNNWSCRCWSSWKCFWPPCKLTYDYQKILSLPTWGISGKSAWHLWKGHAAQGLPPLASYFVTWLFAIAQIKQPSTAPFASLKRPTATYIMRKASANPQEVQGLSSQSCFNIGRAKGSGISCWPSLVNQLLPFFSATWLLTVSQTPLVEKTASWAVMESLGAKGASWRVLAKVLLCEFLHPPKKETEESCNILQLPGEAMGLFPWSLSNDCRMQPPFYAKFLATAPSEVLGNYRLPQLPTLCPPLICTPLLVWKRKKTKLFLMLLSLCCLALGSGI